MVEYLLNLPFFLSMLVCGPYGATQLGHTTWSLCWMLNDPELFMRLESVPGLELLNEI